MLGADGWFLAAEHLSCYALSSPNIFFLNETSGLFLVSFSQNFSLGRSVIEHVLVFISLPESRLETVFTSGSRVQRNLSEDTREQIRPGPDPQGT